WDPACCYSNYLRDKMGDHIHGGPAFTRPATTYFALMSVKATPAGGGTEFVIGTGSYARVVVTNNSTNWPASSSQTKGDGVLLDWGTATANWGTAIQICEYDAATGGNLLTMGDLVTPYVINSGTPFQIPVNGAVFNWASRGKAMPTQFSAVTYVSTTSVGCIKQNIIDNIETHFLKAGRSTVIGASTTNLLMQ